MTFVVPECFPPSEPTPNPCDDRPEVGSEKWEALARVFEADIAWCLERGVAFDGTFGARIRREGEGGEGWSPAKSASCGTCAVGAFLVRRDKWAKFGFANAVEDYGRAARLLRVDRDWMHAFFMAVADLEIARGRGPTHVDRGDYFLDEDYASACAEEREDALADLRKHQGEHPSAVALAERVFAFAARARMGR